MMMSQEATEPQRSLRIRKAPDSCIERVYVAHRLNEPSTVKNALFSPEKNEIDSLHTNKVWDPAELTSGQKANGTIYQPLRSGRI